MTLEQRVQVDQPTPREREIMAALMTGETTDAAIAEQLNVTTSTVHFHLQSIMRKLDVHTRVQVVSFAWQNGILVDGMWWPSA